ncbi:toprim domain-containing protein (plasmid) [Nocardia sp. NBC_01377]|uniref:toprim domain-containing protein n=1 Tax=Nocardia sp. NBC_01377 TaxID=2903595 RepID=UPI002F90B67C
MSAPARTHDEGSWEVITTALDRTVGPGRPSGAWTKYCCPAHEGDGRGHRPSLGVKYDTSQQRTVVRCFAGCDNEVVLDTLGLKVRDMFDRDVERTPGRDRHANRSRPRQVSPADRALDAAGMPLTQPRKPDLGEQVSPWKQVDSYPYARADGTVAGEVIRREADFTRGRDKEFRQRRWSTESGWEPGGFENIPFQLPKVLDAVAEGRVVYIVEGEKDALNAERAGLVATTNAGGATSWTAEHAQWLRGAATVVIVADRDPAGYRRAERITASLDGLVGRVRVLQAATGKDLSEHLECGHEIAELVPIAHLDPYTTAATTPAASADPAPTPGGTSVPEYMLAPSLHDGPAPTHSDEVDHLAAQWTTFVRLLMTYYTTAAQKTAAKRIRHKEQLAEDKAQETRETLARFAAEQAAVEARLGKLAEAGLDNASRTEIVEAVADAIAWAPESTVAAQAARTLASHVHHRFGVEIDLTDLGAADIEVVVPPHLATALVAAEQERAGGFRLKKAQDRMLELVAAETLDESSKAELLAEIEAWRANPTAKQLDSLSRKLEEKGVGAPVRTRVRLVAAYLGTPGQMVPTEQLGEVDAASASRELRKMGQFVDPGEEAKARTDKLLISYQDAVRLGGPTGSLRERLSEAISVMTPEDQAAARARGAAIRANPGEQFQPLWPGHVDRDELATAVRVYAVLAPQAELAAGKAADLDDADARALQGRAKKQRDDITAAIKTGKGLHEWEKDQLELVMRDVEAGKTVAPELLFLDERSAAAADADRAARIAQDTTLTHRRQLEQILETNAAPTGTVARTRDAVTRVMDVQTELAAGRATLPDYEATGLDRQLDAKLTAAGVSEPVRNKVRHHIDAAAREAAIVGKQATRIANQWGERREAVVITRDPANQEPPAYDSPQRRAGLEENLRATAGLDEDSLAQRMAADAAHAKPASAAPSAGKAKGRSTKPGAGVRRTQHRGKGPEKGLGR